MKKKNSVSSKWCTSFFSNESELIQSNVADDKSWPLLALCPCVFTVLLSKFLLWKAGSVTKSTFSDLSQLVGDPSARGPSLLKTISQDGVAYPTDTRGERTERGEADRASREGQEPGIKLGRLIRTGRITAGPEQSAHCLQQTPLSSALCRPHTHSTLLHCPSPFLAPGAFLVNAWL